MSEARPYDPPTDWELESHYTRDINAGKLALTWEGPYRVTAIAGAGAYYMEDLDKRPLPRPWNAHNLKKFYH